MNKRKINREWIEVLPNSDDVDSLIGKLTELKEKAKGKLVYTIHSEDDVYNIIDFNIYEELEETEEQYLARLDFERIWEEGKIKREKAEYERLKSIYGKED